MTTSGLEALNTVGEGNIQRLVAELLCSSRTSKGSTKGTPSVLPEANVSISSTVPPHGVERAIKCLTLLRKEAGARARSCRANRPPRLWERRMTGLPPLEAVADWIRFWRSERYLEASWEGWGCAANP